MKKLWLIGLLLAYWGGAINGENIKVLLLLSNNYGANYNFIRDKIQEYGWEITYNGINDTVIPCAAFAANYGSPPIAVDIRFTDIADISEYDCLLILSAYAGSNPHYEILTDSTALNLVTQAVEESLAVAAYCSGVRVLAAEDVLDGVQITGHANFISEYLAAGVNWLGPQLPPVVDGNIITCTRGQYFNIQNCEAIAEVIENY
jgi:hypothetical protein